MTDGPYAQDDFEFEDVPQRRFEITAPQRVRAGCPRCDWNSPWCWVDDMPNALWFAKKRASNAFHDHYGSAHRAMPSPIWEVVE